MRMPALAMLVLLSLVVLSRSTPAAEDAAAAAPAALLERAFAARYDCTLSGIVDIATHKGRTHALGRRVHVASKLIDDRLHTYVRFQQPPYLRGMAFLGIEPEDRGASDQRFVYLPSLKRIRRVGGSHSSDSFLGTDLSYHDFERQHARDFQVAQAFARDMDGESTWVLEATPRHDADYARVDYEIARTDFAILGTRYYKRGGRAPYKIMRMPRVAIRERGHCRIPAQVRVEDRQRGSSTELDVRALEVDASYENSLFTMMALETSREIPGLRSSPMP